MKLFLYIIALFFSTLTYSQSFKVESLISNLNEKGKIKGIVFDAEVNNTPLSFANITIKNTAISTSSALDGSYSISLKPGTYTLVFSFLGYQTMEVKNVIVSSNNSTINNQNLAALEINFDVSLISLN